MSIFNIETTQETYVPIVVLIVDVGIVRVASLGRSGWDGRLEQHDSATIWDHLAWRLQTCNALSTHVIRKWGTTATAATTAVAATTALTTPAGAIIRSVKLLLDGYRELLDGGHIADSNPNPRSDWHLREEKAAICDMIAIWLAES
jgi:hypothetical protein